MGGADYAIVVFVKHGARAFPVYLAGGGYQQASSVTAGFLEYGLRALDVVDDSAYRMIDHQLYAHRGREMIDHVHLAHQVANNFLIQRRIYYTGYFRQVFDVLEAARTEIVQHEHLVAPRRQGFAKVRADKSGAAGY